VGEETEGLGIQRKEEGWEEVVVGLMEEIRVLGNGEEGGRVEE